MKYIISLIILTALLINNPSANAQLAQFHIVPINKKDPNSTKILAGVANIRFKPNTKTKYNTTQLPAIHNQDFTIIDCYMPNSKKVSNQTNRFNKHTKQQQQTILQCEEILSRTFIVQFPNNIDIKTFCKNILQKYPNIELAEPYYVAQMQSTPNDPEVSRQTLLSTIKALEAWDICQGNEDILIAAGDTGCNITHQDLGEAAIAFNYAEIAGNGQDDDNNGYIDDYLGYNFAWFEDGGTNFYDHIYNQSNSHGLEVIGIVGACTNNKFGIAGVGNKCKIVPIKVCETGINYCTYGYQSMIYAATRGCKVINCSWGSARSYSVVNQSVVDYAIACGTAIVAAAGNDDPNLYSTYYPAGYYGVLGAGSVNNNDILTTHYVKGTGLRITAPDESTRSLSGHQSIKTCSRGTSFAAPVVSGTVGILRTHMPNISPIEATEIVRKSADDVRNKPGNDGNGFVPGRVNMLNALLFDYQNIPSIILKKQHYEDMTGAKQEQFYAKDTAVLVLNVINILGNATNVKLALQLLHCPDPKALTLLADTNNIGTIDTLNKNEETQIKIKFIVNNPSNIRNIIYLLKMNGTDNNSNPFQDDFKIHLLMSDNITTLRNDSIIVSVSDKGTIGYDAMNANTANGVGFEHIKHGSHLFEAGFIATTNLSKVVSTNLDSSIYGYNDFDAVYGTLEPNGSYNNIITDTKLDANLRLGLQATMTYSLPSTTAPVLKTIISAKNISNDFFENFSMGQYYDWDVNSYTYNKVDYFPEGIPNFLSPQTAAAEVATDVHGSFYIGTLAFINTEKYPSLSATPQAAGATGNHFVSSKQNQINALSNGITQQISDFTDINYIVGMHFNNGLASGDSIECIVCTGISSTKESLAKALAECAKTEINSIKETTPNTNYNIALNNNHLLVTLSNNITTYNTTLNLYNLLGEQVLKTTANSQHNDIDLAHLPAGAYLVRIHSSKPNDTKIHSAIIIK